MIKTLDATYDNSLDVPTGWGEPGSIRHAEDIGAHWWHDHPDARELQRRSDEAAAELERARAGVRQALAFEDVREQCGAKAVGTECHRLEHPAWEPHEDFQGHTWFPWESPR
jgi:hypothetical protein